MAGDTHTCEHCGNPESNPNPLDSCGRERIGCDNPCGRGPVNSARCESLPSQIQNFTLQFFGTVVKTEINGQVQWSLPCGLDVGLPENPRGVDEGLACYFLRLFGDGITGLQGPKGCPGVNGTNGHSAYSVVKRGFNQPQVGSPIVQIIIFENPAVVADLYVFIQNSGYYQVTDVQPGGIVVATLVSPAAHAMSYVPPGSLVIPTGPPGATP